MSDFDQPLAVLRDQRLAAHALAAEPAWLWSADASRVLWANGAGLALFDAPSIRALAERSFGPAHPVAAQIARLAPTLAAGTAPRLTRLRGLGRGIGQMLTCLASRVALTDGASAVLIAATEPVGRRQDLAERVRALFDVCHERVAMFGADGALLHACPDAAGHLSGAATLEAIDAGLLAREALSSGRAQGPTTAGTVTLERISAADGSVLLATFAETADEQVAAATPTETQAEPSAGLAPDDTASATPPPAEPSAGERRHPLRFVWQMDGDGRFTLASDEFAALAGEDTVKVMGRPWPEIAAALGLDPDGRVNRAIASRDTWSGVTIDWPASGLDTHFPVELSGLPVFDRDRTFRGYRGFGVCRDIDRLAAAAAARRSEQPESATPPPASVEELPPPPVPKEPGRPELTVVPPVRNVLPFRSAAPAGEPRANTLSPVERKAFSDIARALGAQFEAREAEARQPIPPPAETASEASAPAIETPPAVHEPPSTREMEAVLDRLPLGVLVCRGERPLHANRTLLDWTGHASLDALAAAGGLAPLFAEHAASARADDEPVRALAILNRDGEKLPVEGRMFAVPWGGGRATLFVLSRAEADEHAKVSELALRSAEAEARELKAILDTATDGVIVVDRDGKVVSTNRSAEALFGYESHELFGRSFTDLFAPESHRGALDYLDGLARNGVQSVLNDGREVIGRVREGGLIPLFMTMGRISEAQDKFCAVFRDITQWKRAEEELVNAKRQAERASSAKSDFLAKISHEIRTPLNAIIGFSEVMMEARFGAVENERYREYIGDIHTSGQHLISLINDLLDLSKIEAGKLDLSFDKVMLNEITQQCVALMQPQANRERIIIRTSLAANLPPVVADARSIRQIVLNLLSNSIKFTGPGGQVIVSTATTDRGEVVLRVRDTGVGMSEKDIETALEPFRQLATSGPQGSGGTGLGLPLTKALAEANRATFTIRSAVDAGTLVEITFPTTRVLAE